MAFRSWTLTCRTSIQVRPPPGNRQSAFLIYKSFQSKKKRRDEINHLAVLYFYSSSHILTRSSSSSSHSSSRYLFSFETSDISKSIASCSYFISFKRYAFCSFTLKHILCNRNSISFVELCVQRIQCAKHSYLK